ncbi:geranylgeranyl reductase family protein [bacterium]|nr:geranylgeranyl reductase family protein [bacterium]
MKHADVIIVGAGPAGSWLGIRLAEAGIDSVVFDKATFPRYKACGGGLSRKTLDFLPFSTDGIVEKRMSGAWVSYRKADVLIEDFGPAGVMVMRDAFDDLLAKKYVAAGGSFHDSTPVVRLEEQKEGIIVQAGEAMWQGRVLVGADGALSIVRRAGGFGEHRNLHVALAAEMKVLAEEMQSLGARACFDLDAVPDGYGWIFPKREHVSIGIYTHHRGVDLKARLQEFCRTHPRLQKGDIFHMLGGALPVGGYPRLLQKERMLLVGDAAGVVEPILGEGIYHALLSADIAADSIIGFLKQGKSLSVYSERFVRAIERNVIQANRMARGFYGHLAWTFPVFVQNRIIAGTFAREAIGKSSYTGRLRACLRRLPLIPFAYHRGIPRDKFIGL